MDILKVGLEIATAIGLAGLIGTVVGHILARKQDEAKIENLKVQSDEIESTIWEKLVNRLNTQLDKAFAEVEQLRSEVSRLRKQVDQFTEREANLLVANRLLAEQVNQLKMELVAAKAALEAKEAEVEALRGLVAYGQEQASQHPEAA